MTSSSPICVSTPTSSQEPSTTHPCPRLPQVFVQGDLFDGFPTEAACQTTPRPSSGEEPATIQVSVDGACIRNGRPDAQGGWAVVFDDGREFSGFELGTTNIRMEMKAAIVALRATPIGAAVVVHTDLKLLLRTMRDGWKQKCNHDLWGDIQVLADARSVTWRLVRGHSGHLGNERANRLAQVAARGGRATA